MQDRTFFIQFPFLLFSLFTDGVREAYLDSRLFDVRLVCADGLIFWAHSLVLSVFSDFFAEMARLNLKEINLGDANSGKNLKKDYYFGILFLLCLQF